MINFTILENKLLELHSKPSNGLNDYINKFVTIYKDYVVAVANDYPNSIDTPLTFNDSLMKITLTSLLSKQQFSIAFGSAISLGWMGTTFGIASPINGNIKVSSIVAFGGLPFYIPNTDRSYQDFCKLLTDKIKNHIKSIKGVIITTNPTSGLPVPFSISIS